MCHSSGHLRRRWYWCSEDDGGASSASTAISKCTLYSQISILTYLNLVTREFWPIAREYPRTFTKDSCRCIGFGCEELLQISQMFIPAIITFTLSFFISTNSFKRLDYSSFSKITIIRIIHSSSSVLSWDRLDLYSLGLYSFLWSKVAAWAGKHLSAHTTVYNFPVCEFRMELCPEAECALKRLWVTKVEYHGIT